MSNDTVTKLIQPGTFDDQLTDVLRNGAHALLAHAIEAEVADFLGRYADLPHCPSWLCAGAGGDDRDWSGCRAPPRVRDRDAAAADPGRIRFTPAILPPYVRRSKSVESLLPLLYLKGISKGDFSEALAALFGKDAVGLSASTVGNAGNECGRQYRPDARYLI